MHAAESSALAATPCCLLACLKSCPSLPLPRQIPRSQPLGITAFKVTTLSLSKQRFPFHSHPPPPVRTITDVLVQLWLLVYM